jgi:pimeloyl-ACP methyl ester carboxylesterase
MPMNVRDVHFSRRSLVAGAAVLAMAAAARADRAAAQSSLRRTGEPVPPPPAQAPAREVLAQLADTRLWYTDTGGSGQPVVFLHPATGSALTWGYQQPVFAAAGYRVITYSRRGHYNSDPVPNDKPGSGSQDLHDLLAFLGIGKLHAVAAAAGVSHALDYALSHPDRLMSMVLASGTGGVRDADYVAMLINVRAKGFDDMPPEFRELSPSYRALNPAGVRQWVELHHKAVTGNRFGQKPANEITWAALQQMKVPTLLMTGDADLIWPSPLLRLFAKHIPGNETVIVTEAGHSIYWEQPEVFNRAVLEFIARHST